MDPSSSGRKGPKSSACLVVTIPLLAILLLGAGGIAFVWLAIQPKYVVAGAIRIAPAASGLLDSEPKPFDRDAYAAFVRTQATLLTSNASLLRLVGDTLARRKLTFFSPSKMPVATEPGPSGPERILKQAIAEGVIKATAVPETEMFKLTMVSANPEEAKIIVDCFLQSYAAMYGNQEDMAAHQDRAFLEGQSRELLKRIQDARTQLRRLEDPYDTTKLTHGEEMKARLQNALSEELVRTEMRRINLEATIEVLKIKEKVDIDPEELSSRRQNYVDADLLVQALAHRIADLQVDLAVTRAKEPNDATALQRQQKVLDTLNQQLGNLRQTREQQFNEKLDGTLRAQNRQRLAQAEMELAMELAQVNGYQERLPQDPDFQRASRPIGRVSEAVHDQQLALRLDEELYEKLTRRLREMEIEMGRRLQDPQPYAADIEGLVDNRWQWTLILLGATILFSAILLIVRRVIRPRLPAGDHP